MLELPYTWIEIELNVWALIPEGASIIGTYSKRLAMIERIGVREYLVYFADDKCLNVRCTVYTLESAQKQVMSYILDCICGGIKKG